jgi:hypothetical protein
LILTTAGTDGINSRAAGQQRVGESKATIVLQRAEKWIRINEVS